MKNIIVYIITIIISFFIALFGLQDPLLFRTSNRTLGVENNSDSYSDLPIEEIKYKSHDGKYLCGWYVKHKNSLGIFIFFHGNAGNISSWMHFAKRFYEWGYSILMVEYRGYGKCPGIPTETNLYEEALTAYNYTVNELNYPSNRIILYGKSLGGAVVINLAKKINVSSIVIDSSFTSLPAIANEVMKNLIPFNFAKYVCKFSFNNLLSIKKNKNPILIIHSRNDDVVPFEMGEELYANITANKKLFLESKGKHNDPIWDDILVYNIKQFCLENLG